MSTTPSRSLMQLIGNHLDSTKQWLGDRGQVIAHNWVDPKYKNTSVVMPQPNTLEVVDETDLDRIYTVENPSWIDKPLAQTTRFFSTRTPLETSAISLGTLIANQILDNPLGGTVDAVTLGLTNLRPDEPTVTEIYPPNPQIPGLQADEIRKERERLQKNMAINAMTLAQLRQAEGYLSEQ